MRIISNRCNHEGRGIRGKLLEGSKAALYGREHAEGDMVEVTRRPCGNEDCSEHRSIGVGVSMLRMPWYTSPEAELCYGGHEVVLHCREHAKGALGSVISKRCVQQDFRMRPMFGMNDSKPTLGFRQHAGSGMIDEQTP